MSRGPTGTVACQHRDIETERVTKPDFDEILDRLSAFWGARDLSALHHPMFEGALLIHDSGGAVAAYLFGLFLPHRRLAYVHLVAVRADQRGRGFARILYERFEQLGRAHGCERIKTITTSTNTASIAFHRAMGMSAVEVDDYAGKGRARIVFEAKINDSQPTLNSGGRSRFARDPSGSKSTSP